MTLGGSQFAHLKVASLASSMYLRWASVFSQGNTRRGLGMTGNWKSALYEHRPSEANIIRPPYGEAMRQRCAYLGRTRLMNPLEIGLFQL